MIRTPHFLIVQSRFYPDIADYLAQGAGAALAAQGADFDVLNVPGALEIPAAIKQAAQCGKYDGFVALAAVIRGETYHFEIVSGQSARGLMDLALQHNLAIGNGILTCETMAQAILRADPAQNDLGGGAARAAWRLFEIKTEFEKSS